MLKLKDEIKNNPIVIFVHRSRGRRLKFNPLTVSPSDYPKYKALGFDIFRCDSCETDVCFGDCGIIKTTVLRDAKIKVDKVVPPTKKVSKNEDKDPQEDAIDRFQTIQKEVNDYTGDKGKKLCICGNELSGRKKKYCSKECKNR
jgi:hypothetical protein